MKKIVLITLLLIVSTIKVSACVELTIDKHIDGDPICRLNPGQTLEICLDEKTVRGGSCTFYIIGVEDNVNGMTLQLALDNVSWAPKYAELMINTVTQKMGFLLTHSNNTGVYSYFNETQIKQNKNDHILLQGSYIGTDSENRKIKLEFNDYNLDLYGQNEKTKEEFELGMSYKFQSVTTNKFGSSGEFSYSGDISFFSFIHGTFVLTSDKLVLKWINLKGGTVINTYQILNKDNSK